MNKLYKRFSKLFVILFLSGLSITTTAQTTLTKGDIAFTGYIGNGVAPSLNDQFSFVLLTNITNNTVINFTDNAWLRTSPTVGSFRTGEGTVTYTNTTGGTINAGTEILLTITGAATATATFVGGASAGTATGATMPSLSVNGDQVIAYQGTTAAPTFICAIHMNVYSVDPVPPFLSGGDPVTTTTTDWDSAANTTNASGLPGLIGSNFLTNSVDAIWIPGSLVAEKDNARFNCTAPLNNLAQIRASIYNVANWTTSDDAPIFTLPAGCTFFGTVPIKLINFQAENNISSVLVKWSVTNQIDVNEYEIQRSFDGVSFDKIGAVQAKNSSGNQNINYNFADADGLQNGATIIYYRLKSIEVNGKFTYSEIVKVFNSKAVDIAISNFVNPINSKLAFRLNLKYSGLVNLQLIDANGRRIINTQLQAVVGSNNINLPLNMAISKGIYILKISSNTKTIVTKLFN